MKHKLEEHVSKEANSQRTNVRITPIPSPSVFCGGDDQLLTRFENLDVESESDEGSDMDYLGDGYVPRAYNIDDDGNIPDD